MNTQDKLLILIGLAYFLGSIPFGMLVGLSKGIDPRRAGSGNIGATNLGRLLGGKYFVLVFILDMCKSLLPLLAAGFLLGWEAESRATYLLWLCVGFAAFLGHLFPIFLKFKGGKGVSTAAGILLGLWPYYTVPGLITITSFIVVFYISRYISLGSLVASAIFPIAYLGFALVRGWDPFGRQLPLLIFAILMTLLIFYKHRGNIARLRAGTENRFRHIPSS